jgi:hypothetical protein
MPNVGPFGPFEPGEESDAGGDPSWEQLVAYEMAELGKFLTERELAVGSRDEERRLAAMNPHDRRLRRRVETYEDEIRNYDALIAWTESALRRLAVEKAADQDDPETN